MSRELVPRCSASWGSKATAAPAVQRLSGLFFIWWPAGLQQHSKTCALCWTCDCPSAEKPGNRVAEPNIFYKNITNALWSSSVALNHTYRSIETSGSSHLGHHCSSLFLPVRDRLEKCGRYSQVRAHSYPPRCTHKGFPRGKNRRK